MKWYFALNEEGARGGLGLHARIAVLTAGRAGGLEPHLLYMGARNTFTAWMEAHGVTVIDAAPRFLPTLEAAQRAGRHPANFTGHWLRTVIPLLEHSAAFVLYTDCDVVFRRAPELDALQPATIACGPEFRPDDWRSFNSGVMLMNVPALRRSYPAFEALLLARLGAPGPHFDDQTAYNEFFAADWTRLDPALNWKPYWGFQDRATIVHYHGPKLEAFRILLDGRLDWEETHSCRMGSLCVAALAAYIAHLDDLTGLLAEAPEERDVVAGLLAECRALHRRAPMERIDISFLAG